MVRVAVLNNLRAGRSGPRITRTLELLRRYPDVLHVETDSERAVPEAIAELGRREIDILVVNGGDGTLQYALTEILEGDDFDRIPLIAPLRGGRTNMTAVDFGAHRNALRGLDGLLAAARRGAIEERAVDRPVLRVASAKGGTVHYGMFFGAGMIHRAIAMVHRLFPKGPSQGSVGAGLMTGGLIAKALMSRMDGLLTPDKLQILLDGEMVPHGEFTLVISSGLQRLILGMNPFWGREPRPVRFTALATSSRRKRAAALGVLRGRPPAWVSPELGYTSRNVERAELRLDCGFTVDGEIVAPLSGEVVTLTADRRVRFLRA